MLSYGREKEPEKFDISARRKFKVYFENRQLVARKIEERYWEAAVQVTDLQFETYHPQKHTNMSFMQNIFPRTHPERKRSCYKL